MRNFAIQQVIRAQLILTTISFFLVSISTGVEFVYLINLNLADTEFIYLWCNIIIQILLVNMSQKD